MKAITLTQPWATLIIIGEKSVETRSWGCHYVDRPLAIHASKGFPRWAKELCSQEPFLSSLRKEYPGLSASEIVRRLPTGKVLGTCRVVDKRPTNAIASALEYGISDWYRAIFTEKELAFGDYSPDRWAWIIKYVEKFSEPVPAKGSLGLWEWDQGATK